MFPGGGIGMMPGMGQGGGFMNLNVRSPSGYTKNVVKLVQGGADAFVEASFATNASKNLSQGFIIHAVDYCFPDMPAAYVDADMEFQVSVKSAGSALVAHDDKNLMDYNRLRMTIETSGVSYAETKYREWMDYIVFAPQLYVCFDSTGTGATNTAYLIFWSEDAIVTDQSKLIKAWF